MVKNLKTVLKSLDSSNLLKIMTTNKAINIQLTDNLFLESCTPIYRTIQDIKKNSPHLIITSPIQCHIRPILGVIKPRYRSRIYNNQLPPNIRQYNMNTYNFIIRPSDRTATYQLLTPSDNFVGYYNFKEEKHSIFKCVLEKIPRSRFPKADIIEVPPDLFDFYKKNGFDTISSEKSENGDIVLEKFGHGPFNIYGTTESRGLKKFLDPTKMTLNICKKQKNKDYIPTFSLDEVSKNMQNYIVYHYFGSKKITINKLLYKFIFDNTLDRKLIPVNLNFNLNIDPTSPLAKYISALASIQSFAPELLQYPTEDFPLEYLEMLDLPSIQPFINFLKMELTDEN